MKRVIQGIIAATFFVGPAIAADLPTKAPVYKAAPVAPSYSWAGFYAGAHLGYFWGQSVVVDNGDEHRGGPTNGVVGGVLGGLNWQSGALVLGLDADFGWSNAHGKGVAVETPPSNESYLYDVKWTSHIRGRAGYAAGPWLLFVAGGVAFTDFNVTMVEDAIRRMTCGSTYTGFSIGGGAEYAFDNRVSGRLEYLFDDFGKKTYVMGVNDTYEARLKGSTVRGAIVVKFGP